MSKAVVGVIGGSGVYALEGLEIVKEEKIASPGVSLRTSCASGAWARPSACFSPGTARAIA